MNYPPTIDLTNKVIIVSGGYGHLGKSIVKGLLLHNAIVIVAGRSKEKYDDILKELDEKHLVNVSFQEFDISDSKSIQKGFETVFNKHGRINVLVNNACYLEGQNPETMTDEEWQSGVTGTLSSAFWCTRDIIPYLRKSSPASIINVSSMYGVIAPDFQVYDESPAYLNPPHYGAAKAGLLQLTRYYASYLGKENIRVNSVTPGPFPSKEVQKDKVFVDKLANKTHLKRIGEPEDIAGAFVFLASDAAAFITGQNIVVDGGWTAI
ncbi:MAG: SDR family oxidoreductase [Bacteroidetes bacterium]|nr:SDR family oxidoreductase [Bacteroidota bacterium]